MKQISFLIAALAALISLSSCEKLLSNTEEGEPCTLTVSFNDGTTKVLGQTEAIEKNIKSVQIFVFNPTTGKLDASAIEEGLNVSGSHTLNTTLNCTRGQREVWAIVNAPLNHVNGTAANRITTIEQLKAVSTKLSDNKADALIMVGKESKNLASETETVSVSVERVCAAVVVKSIKNEIGIPAYQVDGKVKITGAYLMNVPNSQKYDLSTKASTLAQADWISPNVKSTNSSELSLTSDAYASGDQTLNYGATFTKSSTFYAYPNECTAAPSSTWAPSKSVLIVEALVDGQKCIYPVTLGTLASNHKYEVNLVIKHIGGDPNEPWKKIEFTNLGSSITVTNWSTGTPITENI